MALRLLENWEGMTSPEEKYTRENSSVVIDTGIYRHGSQSLECGGSDYLSIPIGTLTDTGVIGFAMRVTGGTVANQLVYFINTASGTNMYLQCNTYGNLSLYRSTAQLGISTKQLRPGKWYYVEIKWNCVNSISADSFIVKVNGEEWINLAATTDCQAAAASGVDKIYLNGGWGAVYFDDLYILDLTGGVNDDFLGSIEVASLSPNGNGTTSDFMGSDSNQTDNYLLVDDAQPDGDSTYTESSTVDHVDLYAFDNLATTPTTIFGVQSECCAKKDDSGARTGRILTRVNSTNYEGDIFSPSEGTYEYFSCVWDVNPDDSAAWAEADVNGAEFGVTVEA